MIAPFELSFDLELLAGGFGIPPELVYEQLMDGRIRSLWNERQICNRDGYESAPSKKSPFDVVYQDEHKLEVRSITKNINFNPSKNIGGSRSRNQKDFDEKQDGQAGYLVVDNPTIADDGFTATMQVYFIPTSTIKKWVARGRCGGMGDCKIMARTKLLKLLKVEGLA